MGKLKIALNVLADRGEAMVREIGALTDKMAALATNAGNAMEQLFEGSTSLYIYVAEKLEVRASRRTRRLTSRCWS